MASFSTPFIMIDDTDSAITYSGGSWSVDQSPRWVSGSSTWPLFAAQQPPGVMGDLSFLFNGTSAIFVGDTPPPGCSQTAVAQIDDDAPYNISYFDPSPQTYRQLYQSPSKPGGNHRIAISQLAQTSLDYILIVPDAETPLANTLLAVDDNDAAVAYTGDWHRSKPTFPIGGPINALAFANGTHGTNNPGSTATFFFTGTSVSVYSILASSSIGSLTASFTIDASTPQTSTYNANGVTQSNILLYQSTNLTANSHVLTIELVESDGEDLVLDYFTYQPSFSNLASMPPVPTLLTHPSLSIPLPTPSGTGVQPPSQSGVYHSSHNKAPTAIIIGVVLVGISVVAVILSLILFLRRRRKHKKDDTNVDTTDLSPFTVSVSSQTRLWRPAYLERKGGSPSDRGSDSAPVIGVTPQTEVRGGETSMPPAYDEMLLPFGVAV